MKRKILAFFVMLLVIVMAFTSCSELDGIINEIIGSFGDTEDGGDNGGKIPGGSEGAGNENTNNPSNPPAGGAGENNNTPDDPSDSTGGSVTPPGSGDNESTTPPSGGNSGSGSAGSGDSGESGGSSGTAQKPAIDTPSSKWVDVEINGEVIPEYSGTPYYIVNNNVPFFTNEEKVSESYEYYGKLDSLGRCTIVMACIGRDLMPTGARPDDSLPNPSGWNQASYSVVSGRYLYNRCHLIGWQLTGETTNRSNLITGTKYFNIDGMLGWENKIADYIKETNNHVMYRVTPIFNENELVARGVLMEIYSVEDEGEELCYNLFLYNIQPNIIIDYADGSSCLHPDAVEPEQPEQQPENQPGEEIYVLNTNSKKIHCSDCTHVSRMSESNKAYCKEEELDTYVAQGYIQCNTCTPLDKKDG